MHGQQLLKQVGLPAGPESVENAQQRAGVIAAVKSILGSDSGSSQNSLLQAVHTLPSPQLRAVLAIIPQDGKIAFPTAAMSAWIGSSHALAKALLAPL